MRLQADDEDPKKPRPLRSDRKPIGAPESGEAEPWSHLFKDSDRDRHHHVA